MKKQEENSLDKLFSSLHEIGNEVPSAAFLKDLEQRLDAHKKRRKPLFFWWFVSVFGAVLLLFAGYNWKNSNSNTVFSSNNSAQNHAKSHSKAQSQLKLRSTVKSLPLIPSISRSKSKSPSSNPTSNSSLHSSTFRSSSSSFSFSPSSTADVTFKDMHPSVLANSYAISASSPGLSVPQSISTNDTFNADTTTAVYAIDIIDTNSRAKDQQAQVLKQAPAMYMAPAKKRTTIQSIGLQFGLSGIFSSFEVPSQYASITGYNPLKFRSERELSERQTSSWDFNLRYQYQFGKLGLQTGLNYLEWGEQYKYAVISVEGTNRYQYLQIPLGVSYQIRVKKVILQPTFGIAFGYGLQTNGAYILPENNGVVVVSSEQFSSNIWTQLELIYQLNEQMCVSVAPIYRRTIGDVVNNGLIINTYQSVGLLTGLSFRF